MCTELWIEGDTETVKLSAFKYTKGKCPADTVKTHVNYHQFYDNRCQREYM